MAFKLDSVVPWGRNLEEYKLMFGLDDRDMTKKIAGFGDGPACFNYEMTNAGGNVVSFDPIYQFSKEEIEKRIEKVRITVMQQMRENMDNYVWTHIKDLDELVPADTLPVLTSTLLVATIPVPASPSGGHIGAPA